MKIDKSAAIFISATLVTTLSGTLLLGVNPLAAVATKLLCGLALLGWLWLIPRVVGRK